jgi:hypothetical protein
MEQTISTRVDMICWEQGHATSPTDELSQLLTLLGSHISPPSVPCVGGWSSTSGAVSCRELWQLRHTSVLTHKPAWPTTSQAEEGGGCGMQPIKTGGKTKGCIGWGPSKNKSGGRRPHVTPGYSDCSGHSRMGWDV